MNKVFPIGHHESADASSHVFPASEALAMRITGPEWNSVKFALEAVQQLLAQGEVHGVGIYYAHNGDHTTVVLAALDTEGNPIQIPDAIALENGERCPPFC